MRPIGGYDPLCHAVPPVDRCSGALDLTVEMLAGYLALAIEQPEAAQGTQWRMLAMDPEGASETFQRLGSCWVSGMEAFSVARVRAQGELDWTPCGFALLSAHELGAHGAFRALAGAQSMLTTDYQSSVEGLISVQFIDSAGYVELLSLPGIHEAMRDACLRLAQSPSAWSGMRNDPLLSAAVLAQHARMLRQSQATPNDLPSQRQGAWAGVFQA